MKKQLLLLSFALIFFFGSQTTFAQSEPAIQKHVSRTEVTPRMRAMNVIESFSRVEGVRMEQKKAILALFNDNEGKFMELASLKDSKLKSENQDKMQMYIDGHLKEILTAKQFQLYTKSKF